MKRCALNLHYSHHQWKFVKFVIAAFGFSFGGNGGGGGSFNFGAGGGGGGSSSNNNNGGGGGRLVGSLVATMGKLRMGQFLPADFKTQVYWVAGQDVTPEIE